MSSPTAKYRKAVTMTPTEFSTQMLEARTPDATPKKAKNLRARWLSFLPLITAVTISFFAMAEIQKRFFEHRLSHAHGLLSMGIVKIAYSLGELQGKVREVEDVMIELDYGDFVLQFPRSPSPLQSEHNFRSKLTMVVCIFALFACTLEILRDLRPSGHHGTAVLAASELVNQFFRLRRTSRNQILLRRFIIMFVAIPAAACAGRDLIDDLKPGAHHAVAVLAVAQFVENFHRAAVAFVVTSPVSRAIVV